MKQNFIYLLIITFIILIFKNNDLLLVSAINATNIWFNKVFPYLFIMIIINDSLINLGIINKFKNPVLYIFIISLLSGTPLNAYIIGNLYKNNSITKNNANTMLLFTYFSNPLFLWTILNNIFINKYIAIKFILIHYLSNIIIFLIYNKKLDNKLSSSNINNFNISTSIKKSIDTNIVVFASICFYFIVSDIIINTFSINIPFNIIIKGFLEMTQGLNCLITYNNIYKPLLVTIFISFGGLSIHTQIKYILNEYHLEYNYFLKGRLFQTAISIILTLLLWY